MWRLAQTIEDATLIAEICEQAEPKEYGFSHRKGGLDKRVKQFMEENFINPEEAWFIYEDGVKKIALALEKRPNELGRIMRVCYVGFGADIYENCKGAMPLFGDKIREVFDAWGIKRFWSRSPRTLKGECEAALAEAFIGEAEVKIDGNSVRFDYDRDNKLPNENEYKLLKQPSKVDSDALKGKILQDLK